mmetsp:Transcript_34009/g.61105  ORF Transcript_34009/g.61105 Transcript_34009/m.61105 type:complete len:116 (+) Transcript_34009:1549-1896(+)
MLSSSEESDANAESAVQALEDPRRRHSTRGQSLLNSDFHKLFIPLSVEQLSSELLADNLVVTNSKMCNLDPVDPASITMRNGEDDCEVLDDVANNGSRNKNEAMLEERDESFVLG